MSDAHKRMVQQVNDAFAAGDTEKFLSLCAEDVVWTIAGEETVEGKAAVRKWMGTMEGEPPKLTVEAIIAEGDRAMAQGRMMMKGSSGAEESYVYCDVYRFRDGQIAELTAFVVRTDKPRSGNE